MWRHFPVTEVFAAEDSNQVCSGVTPVSHWNVTTVVEKLKRHTLLWLTTMSCCVQAVDTTILGLDKETAKEKPYIASMGIYVFKKDVLLKLLRWERSSSHSYGAAG